MAKGNLPGTWAEPFSGKEEGRLAEKKREMLNRSLLVKAATWEPQGKERAGVDLLKAEAGAPQEHRSGQAQGPANAELPHTPWPRATLPAST